MAKVSELVGPALDWAVVVKCEGMDMEMYLRSRLVLRPSVIWGQGGPIKERERINTSSEADSCGVLFCCAKADLVLVDGCFKYCRQFGPTELIAAMRCYVASKLGEEIEIPKELLNG